jgi:uncharacterized protein (DUF433 family)
LLQLPIVVGENVATLLVVGLDTIRQEGSKAMGSNQRLAERREGKYRVREISKYIVAHQGICHGQPTFRGTRVLVHLALESLQEPGQTVETVARDYGLPAEAIADALRVAADWFRYRLRAQAVRRTC